MFHHYVVNETTTLFDGNLRQLSMLHNQLNHIRFNNEIHFRNGRMDEIKCYGSYNRKNTNKFKYSTCRKPTTTTNMITYAEWQTAHTAHTIVWFVG